MILLSVDDVVLMAHEKKGLHVLVSILQDLNDQSRLKVNVGKTKLMVVRTFQPQVLPPLPYEGHQIEVVKAFKYLCTEIPANHKWVESVERRLETGKGKYYMLESPCQLENVGS